MSGKVFFITGCSTGFGEAYVQAVIDGGDKVVATARNPNKLSFRNTTDSNYLQVALDVTSQDSIDKAFKAALDKFGQVDVVCNNAGYGLSGEFESLSDKQIRTQFEVNYFGLINTTRTAMEVMREKNKKQGGIIQQVTSIGGQLGKPTYSIYCSTKFAVEGFTEAIAQEVKPEWGIKFCCIEPGGFRTDWAGRSMQFGDNKNAAYDHIDAEANSKKFNGKQGGDPVKAGKAMYQLGLEDNPPPRVVLGNDAWEQINKKYGPEGHIQGYKKYEKISTSCQVGE